MVPRIAIGLLALMAANAPADVIFDVSLSGRDPGVGNAIIEARDGDLLVIGYATVAGRSDTDIVLARMSPTGTIRWRRTYGGDGDDFGWDLREDRSGDLWVVGYAQDEPGGDLDVLLMRTSASGDVRWERRFGGPRDEAAWAMELTDNGDVVICAQTESFGSGERDVYVLRVASSGEEVWNRVIGGPGVDRIFSMAPSPDGGHVFTGIRSPDVDADLDGYLLKLSATGHTVWERTFGGDRYDVGHGVVAVDGGYLVSGYGQSFAESEHDVYLLKVDEAGETVWFRTVGGEGDDRAMMSAPLADGGSVTIGYSSVDGQWKPYLITADTAGSVTSDERWARPGVNRGVMVAELSNGTRVMTGSLPLEADRPGVFGVVGFR